MATEEVRSGSVMFAAGIIDPFASLYLIKTSSGISTLHCSYVSESISTLCCSYVLLIIYA